MTANIRGHYAPGIDYTWTQACYDDLETRIRAAVAAGVSVRANYPAAPAGSEFQCWDLFSALSIPGSGAGYRGDTCVSLPADVRTPDAAGHPTAAQMAALMHSYWNSDVAAPTGDKITESAWWSWHYQLTALERSYAVRILMALAAEGTIAYASSGWFRAV